MYNRLPTNPQCPFLYEDRNIIPQDWSEVQTLASIVVSQTEINTSVFLASEGDCSILWKYCHTWFSHLHVPTQCLFLVQHQTTILQQHLPDGVAHLAD